HRSDQAKPLALAERGERHILCRSRRGCRGDRCFAPSLRSTFLAGNRCDAPLDRGDGRYHHRSLSRAPHEVHCRMSQILGGPIWSGATALVLASRSAARRDLLSRCGIEPEVLAADVDERVLETELIARGALPSIVARRLATAKTEPVSRSAPGRHVLGAD